MPKPMISYRDFRGGLNVDSAPDNLADNELTKAQNIDLSERGGFSKRKGTVALNSTSYGCQIEQVFEWLKKDGSAVLLAVMEDALYDIASDGSRTKVTALATGTRNVFNIAFNDVLYFGDAVNYLYYNGTNTGNVQITTIPGTPALGVSGSGTLNGNYKCKVVFYNEIGVESPASQESPFVSANNIAQFNWSNIVTGPTGTVGRRLYRTKTNGSVFYLAGEIANNSATTYSESKADSELGRVLTENYLTPIKRCKFAVYHSKSCRYMYAGDVNNKTALYYSEPNEPYKVKSTSILYPTHAMGEITGLKEFGDTLIVFYRYGARILRGIDPEVDMIWDEIPIRQGAIANNAVTLTPNTLTFLGNGGLYTINSGILGVASAVTPGENLVLNLSERKVNSIIRDIITPHYACSICDSFNNRLLLAYNDASGTERNNKVLVYDWEIKAFTIYTGWNVNGWCIRNNGDLLFASNGYIYKANHDVYSDNGVPIDAFAETKFFDLGAANNEKRTYKVYVLVKPGAFEKSGFSLTIKSDDDTVFYQYLPVAKNFTWGMPWGSPWGNESVVSKEFKAKLKGIRFKISYRNNKLDESLTIYGNSFEFKMKKAKGEGVDENAVAV